MQHNHYGGGGGYATTLGKNESYLDTKALGILLDIHLRSHWPSLCRRMMIDELVQQEPHFQINGRDIEADEVSPLFRELIQQYYIKFFLDAYDEIMTAGVVFLKIIKAPSGDRVPSVISGEHLGRYYQIIIRDTGGENIYRVLKVRNTKGELITPRMMPDVIPMDHFGVAPSKDGSLNSRLASLVDQEIYYQYVMRMSLQAEFTLSNPPLVTQTRVDAAALPTDERQIDFYQDDEFEQEQQRGIYRRDRATVKHVQDHFQQSYASSNTPHVKEKLGEFNNSFEIIKLVFQRLTEFHDHWWHKMYLFELLEHLNW
jgi:hypothetical protein